MQITLDCTDSSEASSTWVTSGEAKSTCTPKSGSRVNALWRAIISWQIAWSFSMGSIRKPNTYPPPPGPSWVARTSASPNLEVRMRTFHKKIFNSQTKNTNILTHLLDLEKRQWDVEVLVHFRKPNHPDIGNQHGTKASLHSGNGRKKCTPLKIFSNLITRQIPNTSQRVQNPLPRQNSQLARSIKNCTPKPKFSVQSWTAVRSR